MIKLFVLLFGSVVWNSANAWQSPEQAVDEFLKFELAGGRTESWEFNKYLAVSSDYDEPGWDSIHLIKDSKRLSMTCAKNRCIAKVKFDFQATKDLKLVQVERHPNGGSEVIKYVVVKVNGSWLLKSSNGTPRVSYTDFKRLYPNGI